MVARWGLVWATSQLEIEYRYNGRCYIWYYGYGVETECGEGGQVQDAGAG